MGIKLIKPAGFTLFEYLLTIALIAVLVSIAIPVYQTFQARNDLDLAATTVAQTLRRAQLLSQTIEGDTSWGVYIQNNRLTLFRGVSYSEVGRDDSFDEVFDLPSSITPSGIFEIVFTKLTGEPQSAGNIILTNTNSEIRTITINAKGMVDY